MPVTFQNSGKDAPPQLLEKLTMVIEGDLLKAGDKARIKLDPTKKPKHLDITQMDGPDKDKRALYIYELDGDTLKICGALDKDRPSGFSSTPENGYRLVVLRREKK